MNSPVVQTFGFLTAVTLTILVLAEAAELVPVALLVFAVAWFIVLWAERHQR